MIFNDSAQIMVHWSMEFGSRNDLNYAISKDVNRAAQAMAKQEQIPIKKYWKSVSNNANKKNEFKPLTTHTFGVTESVTSTDTTDF